MVRVRHYTKVSSRDKMLADGRIVAGGRNRVFFEYASRKPRSASDVRDDYLLKDGKGNAYVEFDADPAEIESKVNKLKGFTEFYIVGDVDLTDRNAVGHDNF